MTDSQKDAGSGVILLTGATGYVGGRLLRALAERGHRVRCLARRPESLTSRVPAGTEVVPGDCLRRETLDPALEGVRTAYYLVHSMAAGAAFEEQDRLAARSFGEAARAAGVRKIIYLGGLGEAGAGLSAHLRSRQETGDVLRAASGVPVIEFRASVVLGSGSLSFDLIRSLVERLPVLICPRWVETKAQPIAIEDLVAYLLAALDLDPGEGRTLEIGGADQVTYGDLMREYAAQRGLRRWLIP
ncbi:NAD-dependent epimerase/dehydratase family protein, partial [bacterium]|nr:NAD-dependent epimerase/dehydratase family protein [bacterium]